MKGDTICALCTPKGKGAISLIRISGPKALEITRKLAGFLPLKPETRRVYFGVLKEDNKPLDKILVSYFAEGQSFTGEESLEISCHGGEIYNSILKALLNKGARLAERGEFSLQAVSNGKMDLVQAEGLLHLIKSQSETARRQAFGQLQGLLSKKLKELENKWLYLLSHLEADIDFALEGLDTFQEKQIEKFLLELQSELSDLLSRYKPFENLQKGLIFGIFGQVNSGKSSLFNTLLKEDKAIISEEEGTTRDLVEGQLFNPQGLNVTLKDSAGFRLSESEGEMKGQTKSRELFFSCDYKIVLLDAVCFEKQKLEKVLFDNPSKTFLVFTKKDLAEKHISLEKLLSSFKKKLHSMGLEFKDSKKTKQTKKTNFFSSLVERTFFVSSLTGEGIEILRRKILSCGELQKEDFLISNYRHYKGLKIMEESLKSCLSLLKNSQGERDIMALELRRGLLSLYEILGKQIEDRVLDCIFKEFCIGK